jgi:hypothetical protein
MKDGAVSGRILAALQQNAEGDEAVMAFLKEVLFAEAEGLRGLKEVYERLIAQYSHREEAAHEN